MTVGDTRGLVNNSGENCVKETQYLLTDWRRGALRE